MRWGEVKEKGGGEMVIGDLGMTAVNGAGKKWKRRKREKRRR